MKQNLLLVCFDYNLSQLISKKLANEFSMRCFDQLELFEFDNIPLTFDEIEDKFGKEYIEKNLRSIIKMETEFKDAVFVVDINFVRYAKDIFDVIFENNFVVLMKKNTEDELKSIEKKDFESEKKKEFFGLTEENLTSYENAIEKMADVVSFVDGLDEDEIVEKIIDEIQNSQIV